MSDIKITNTVINPKCQLIGFFIKTPASDEQPIFFTIEELSQKGLNLLKYDNSKKIITEREGIRINKLPMLMCLDSGCYTKFRKVDNTIELISKIEENKEIIGFKTCLMGEKILYLKYKEIIELTNWFYPINFVIRHTQNGEIIAGKPWVLRLGELPAISINKIHSQYKISFKELIDIIREYNGVIIDPLPEEETTDTNFHPLTIGGIAYPKIESSEHTLNSGFLFRVPGKVQIQTDNLEYVDTFVWSKKSFFTNMRKNRESIIIGIPLEGLRTIKKKFGSGIILNEITDNTFKDTIKRYTNNTLFKFYEIDITHLDILTQAETEKFILDTKQLYRAVKNLAICKMRNKLLWEVLNDLKNEYLELNIGQIHKFYNNFSKEKIEKIENAGIDIFTGKYKKRTSIGEKIFNLIDIENPIVIEYSNPETDKKFEILNESLNRSKDKLRTGERMGLGIQGLKDISDVIEKCIHIESQRYEIKNIINYYQNLLYFHKIAMLKKNTDKIHVHDNENWEQIRKWSDGTKVYKCCIKGQENLILKSNGVSL